MKKMIALYQHIATYTELISIQTKKISFSFHFQTSIKIALFL